MVKIIDSAIPRLTVQWCYLDQASLGFNLLFLDNNFSFVFTLLASYKLTNSRTGFRFFWTTFFFPFFMNLFLSFLYYMWASLINDIHLQPYYPPPTTKPATHPLLTLLFTHLLQPPIILPTPTTKHFIFHSQQPYYSCFTTTNHIIHLPQPPALLLRFSNHKLSIFSNHQPFYSGSQVVCILSH